MCVYDMTRLEIFDRHNRCVWDMHSRPATGLSAAINIGVNSQSWWTIVPSSFGLRVSGMQLELNSNVVSSFPCGMQSTFSKSAFLSSIWVYSFKYYQWLSSAPWLAYSLLLQFESWVKAYGSPLKLYTFPTYASRHICSLTHIDFLAR